MKPRFDKDTLAQISYDRVNIFTYKTKSDKECL